MKGMTLDIRFLEFASPSSSSSPSLNSFLSRSVSLSSPCSLSFSLSPSPSPSLALLLFFLLRIPLPFRLSLSLTLPPSLPPPSWSALKYGIRLYELHLQQQSSHLNDIKDFKSISSLMIQFPQWVKANIWNIETAILVIWQKTFKIFCVFLFIKSTVMKAFSQSFFLKNKDVLRWCDPPPPVRVSLHQFDPLTTPLGSDILLGDPMWQESQSKMRG